MTEVRSGLKKSSNTYCWIKEDLIITICFFNSFIIGYKSYVIMDEWMYMHSTIIFFDTLFQIPLVPVSFLAHLRARWAILIIVRPSSGFRPLTISSNISVRNPKITLSLNGLTKNIGSIKAVFWAPIQAEALLGSLNRGSAHQNMTSGFSGIISVVACMPRWVKTIIFGLE